MMRKRWDLAAELCAFFAANKKLWLLPVALAMLALGALLVLAQTSSLAPLIYTLF